MKPSDITVCVGVDSETIKQLAISLPTWKRYRPQMWDMQWLVFYDSQSGVVWPATQLDLPPHRVIAWPPLPVHYETQREKMVSGHVFVPGLYAQTKWSMKVDTDAIATREDDWLKDEWFDCDDAGRWNRIIAPAWGYSKSKGGGGDITAWATKLEQFGDLACPEHPPLCLHDHIQGSKIVMPRIASWLSFYSVPWLRLLSQVCTIHCGAYKLPVPSQDTTAHYFAARRGDRITRFNMRKVGWENYSRIDDLRAAAENVLR